MKRDNYIDLNELKLMMEKLGAPQTHLGLKNMIKEVDEDLDNKLSFREVSEDSASRSFHASSLIILTTYELQRRLCNECDYSVEYHKQVVL